MKIAVTFLLVVVLTGAALQRPATAPITPVAPSIGDEKPPVAQAVAARPNTAYWPAGADATTWTGAVTREPHENFALLTLRGTPAERGTAHGKLLAREVLAVVKGVKRHLSGADNYKQCLEGTRVMRKFIDADVLEELDACAAAAEIDKDDLLLAQLFGDVARAKGIRTFCSAFAAFGPATEKGALIVGRNFDYAGFGLEEGTPVIMQIIPKGDGAGRPFVTIGYAGILNGWTAMNIDGLCVSNNTLFSGTDSLEGMSTCFLLRKIAERARTVEEGVKLIETTPRACTTGMLVAGKNDAGTWDARFVEFDSKSTAVVAPVDGVVLSTNSRQKLAYNDGAKPSEVVCTRFTTLKAKLAELKGRLTFSNPQHDVIAAKGVYMGINLHAATLDPGTQSIRLAVKAKVDGKPAAEEKFRTYKVNAESIELVK
jgi:hypothetical protein